MATGSVKNVNQGLKIYYQKLFKSYSDKFLTFKSDAGYENDTVVQELTNGYKECNLAEAYYNKYGFPFKTPIYSKDAKLKKIYSILSYCYKYGFPPVNDDEKKNDNNVTPDFTYKYSSDFDTNGLFYALGTDFNNTNYDNPAKTGKVELDHSKMYYSSEAAHNFIGRNETTTLTAEDTNSFFSVDLISYKFRPSRYSLRNYGNSYYMKSWDFQGSNDGNSWISIKKHSNDYSLNAKYKTKTWSVYCKKYYRYFRIRMTAKNSYPSWKLYCSGMEMYGDLVIIPQKRFRHSTDFDTNGLLYALGTNWGTKSYTNPATTSTVMVNHTVMYSGYYGFQMIGRERKGTMTDDDDNPFFSVNLIKWKLKPTRYTLRNCTSSDCIKSWNFMGSTNGNNWVILRKHTNDLSLKGSGKSCSWKLYLNSKDNTYYQYFKVMMTDKNTYPSKKLYCSGFEVYGDLCHISIGGSASSSQGDGALKQNVFNYVSDFDSNGLLYALGSNFGSTSYSNPAQSGKVKISSSKMYSSYKAYSMIGRTTTGTMTDDDPNAFFSVDLIDYCLKPTHYTIRNNTSSDCIKDWNFMGSLDGINWIILECMMIFGCLF